MMHFSPSHPNLEYAWSVLHRTVQTYAHHQGPNTAAQCLETFSQVVPWLDNLGHGNIVLSAVSHGIGEHLRFESVCHIPPSMPLEVVLAHIPMPIQGTVTLYVHGGHVGEKILISETRKRQIIC